MSNDDREDSPVAVPLPAGWARAVFDEVFYVPSDGGRKLPTKDYLPSGRYPVIDQGEKPIGGFTNDESLVFPGPYPVVLFGDHTRRFKFVCDRFAIGADGVKLIGLPSAFSPDFLFYALQQARFEDRGYSRHFAFVRKCSFDIAPVREQERIVAALDERLSELDASVASLERAERNLVRYRAAVLAAACSGKLVPTEADLARRAGRSYEPADQLLARILAERRKANTKAKYEEPSQPDTSKLPKLPEGWAWATMGQMADVRLGKMLSAKAREASLEMRPYLRNENVRWGWVDTSDLKVMGFESDEIARYTVNQGDLVICEGGEAGRCAVYRAPASIMYQKAIHRLRPYGNLVSVDFLQRVFECGVKQGRWFPRFSETTIQHLPQEKLLEVAVPLPPAAEQERIVAEVDRHLSRADALAASIAQSKRRAQRLRRAILAAAFQGRLVPQDPNDEPASVLLDRIRAQAATAEAATASAPRRGRPPAPARAAEPVAAYDAPAPKRRGRPTGSKNKTKA